MMRLARLVAAMAMLASACKGEPGHDHSSEHPAGHDHHDRDHGHGEMSVVRTTRWSEHLELFAEHVSAVAGQETALLAHITVLDDFRALERGTLHLELAGPSPVRAESMKPLRPGIFQLTFTLPAPGVYRGRLVVKGELEDVIDGLELVAHEDEARAKAAVPPEEEGRYVELLKEQQWGVPFATAFVREGSLVESIEVAGTVDTPPGGMADVGAPIAGRLVAPAAGLPRPGTEVRKGQILATLAPAPSSPEDASRIGLAIAEAEARATAARAALARAERLIGDEAISQRELEEARGEAKVAEEAVRAAQRAARLFAGASAGAGAGSWRLVAPIRGTLAEVRARPGSAVSAGDVLFRIVDTRELWIRARVPEQDAARLRVDRDASFQIAGLAAWLPIDITGADATASLVTVGRMVDPVSRTVDVIHALSAPDPKLRVGGLVRVSLPAGEDFTGVVVPRSAIVDDEGRSVVYVQVDGEHFEERIVRTGPHAGEHVGISSGLRADERIVIRGAHIVRLAGRSGSSEPHGHIH